MSKLTYVMFSTVPGGALRELSMTPPTVSLAAVGALVLVLDKHLPGLAEEWRQQLESDRTRSAIIKLRGPRSAPEVVAIAEEAEAWAGSITLVADALRPRRGKKRA